MGNCMRSGSARVSAKLTDDELIMVMRMDGKIMEFTAPFLVSDLTAAYPRHSLVHSGDLCRPLSPDYKLHPGQLYCLRPIPNSPSQVSENNKDTVLSDPESIDNGGCEGGMSGERQENTAPSSGKPVQNGSGFTRVKMVISKQELEALLSDCSMKEKSVEQVWVQLQSKAQNVKEDYAAKRCNGVWRPSLERIPEIN